MARFRLLGLLTVPALFALVVTTVYLAPLGKNAEAQSVSNPYGSLDLAADTHIGGWACDPDNFGQALQVHLYADGPAGVGTLIGAPTADWARTGDTGVAQMCGGTIAHGFNLATPDSLKDGRQHMIYAYAINIGAGNDNSMLQGSPKALLVQPTNLGAMTTQAQWNDMIQQGKVAVRFYYNADFSQFSVDITNNSPYSITGHAVTFKLTSRDPAPFGVQELYSNGAAPQTIAPFGGTVNFYSAAPSCDMQGDFYIGNTPIVGEVKLNQRCSSGTVSSSSSSTATTLVNNSQCLDITGLPSTLTAGQQFTATFSVKNNGTKTWIATAAGAQNGVKLGSNNPIDNNTFQNGRLALPGNVAPGQSVNVTGTFRAPSTSGNYAFSYRTLEEGVAWFGQSCDRNVTVQAAAAACTSPLSLDQVKAYMQQGKISFDSTSAQNGWTINNMTDCSFPLSVYSARMIDTIQNQQQHDLRFYDVPAHSNSSYTVSVPSNCGYQYDMWYGKTQTADNNWTVNGLDGKIVGSPCSSAVSSSSSSTSLVNNSQCLDITGLPSTLTAGQQFTATFSVKNNGTKTWIATAAGAQNGVKLGSNNPIDNNTFQNGRLALPGNVAPGQSVNVTGTFRAPSTSGNYAFSYRTLEEGVAWFGQSCDRNVTVIATASSSSAYSSSAYSSSAYSSSAYSSTPNYGTCDLNRFKSELANGNVTLTRLGGKNGWNIRNNTNCNWDLTVYSARMIGTRENQRQFDLRQYTVNAYDQSENLTVAIPSDCGYQYDIWFGRTSEANNNWAVNGLDGEIVGSPCQDNGNQCTSPLSASQVQAYIQSGKIRINRQANQGSVRIDIQNDTGCSFPATVNVSKTQNDLQHHDGQSYDIRYLTVAGNGTTSQTLSAPLCGYHVHVWWGNSSIQNNNWAANALYGQIEYANGQVCSGISSSSSSSVITTTVDATCTAINVPQNVRAGDQFTAVYRLQNTGTRTWNSGYRFGRDDSNWGLSGISLPYDVAPGNSVLLSGNFRAPQNTGNQGLWMRMYEGNTSFGATCQQMINIQTATATNIVDTNTTTNNDVNQNNNANTNVNVNGNNNNTVVTNNQSNQNIQTIQNYSIVNADQTAVATNWNDQTQIDDSGNGYVTGGYDYSDNTEYQNEDDSTYHHVVVMPQTGAGDNTAPLQDTAQFLRPVAAAQDGNAAPLAAWTVLLSLGTTVGGFITRKFFL